MWWRWKPIKQDVWEPQENVMPIKSRSANKAAAKANIIIYNMLYTWNNV